MYLEKKNFQADWVLKPDTKFASTFSDTGEGEADH